MKLKQFQRYIQEKEIDLVFLVHPDSNITYLTQANFSFSFLLITSQSAELYLTSLDKKVKTNQFILKEIKKNWEQTFSHLKCKTLGINKKVLTVAYLEKLRKMWPKAKFVDIFPKLEELRLQKTPKEIKIISKASKITTNAFNDLLNNFNKHKFNSEQDVAFYLEKKIKNQGAKLAFPTIVASAKNAAIPHHQTSTNSLRKGFLLLDFGAKYNNYCSDLSRMLFLGTPTKAEKRLYQLLLDAQQSTIEQIKEKKQFSNLDQHARNCLGNYSIKFIHSLGHGVGIDIHENPKINKETKEKIKQNTVFTIEPGLYFPKKQGLRIEDTLLFNGKVQVLTKVSKELVCLPI